jgi:hypothetical protein
MYNAKNHETRDQQGPMIKSFSVASTQTTDASRVSPATAAAAARGGPVCPPPGGVSWGPMPGYCGWRHLGSDSAGTSRRMALGLPFAGRCVSIGRKNEGGDQIEVRGT